MWVSNWPLLCLPCGCDGRRIVLRPLGRWMQPHLPSLILLAHREHSSILHVHSLWPFDVGSVYLLGTRRGREVD